jgi:hypothetical protein
MAVEERLAYRVPSGRYWKEQFRFDTDNIDALDSLWLEAHKVVDVASEARR